MAVEGRRVIVTGASSGLGAHAVRELVAHGADVLAVARRGDRLEEMAAELAGSHGRMVPFRGDVTLAADAQALVTAAVDAFGGVDVLVNNAAPAYPVEKSRAKRGLPDAPLTVGQLSRAGDDDCRNQQAVSGV